MNITDPSGGRWTVVRQIGAWRRRSRVVWAWDMMPTGLGIDPVSAVITIPFLVLALILFVLALVEMALLLLVSPVALLLRALKVTGWRVAVLNTAKPVEVEVKTGAVRLRRARFSTTVLEVGTMAGGARLRDEIAEHLRQGGDVTDPVVDEWLSAEGGRRVWRETKPGPEPVSPTEPG